MHEGFHKLAEKKKSLSTFQFRWPTLRKEPAFLMTSGSTEHVPPVIWGLLLPVGRFSQGGIGEGLEIY